VSGVVEERRRLSVLELLEAESIHVLREVAAVAERPVMLYSAGKDSSVMLHLARKAFHPGRLPFPLLHVDTGLKFDELVRFRDEACARLGVELRVSTAAALASAGTNPWEAGTVQCCAQLKTQALVEALHHGGYDAAFGGARREEERSRAKERIFSLRDERGQWDPKRQRPELWSLYNARVRRGESMRVFPLSNWTELDVWRYIAAEQIPVAPLYFSQVREVVVRDGQLLLVSAPTRLLPGERPAQVRCRFRTVGCSPCTGAVASAATTVEEIIEELSRSRQSERTGRVIDHDRDASMEQKKREGYF
jgi:sulfate adenylyltransferase subunit 2